MKTPFNTLKAIIPLLLLAPCLHAQEKKQQKFAIGIHATPTYSTVHYKTSTAEHSRHKPLIGYIAGISGQFNLCSLMTLRVELNHEKAGFTFIPDHHDFIGDIVGHAFIPLTKSVTEYNNITLPVSLKFNFIKRDKINVFVNAGTCISYTYSTNQTYYFENGTKQQMHDTYSYKLGNNYNPGALIGAGTDITLTNRIHLTLEARDQLNVRTTNYERRNAIGLLTGFSFQL